jgi:hypothetical protein
MPERSTDMHPGRDPELLEQYTLGKLSGQERSAIDDHLRECHACRQLLEEELRLAAGVRQAARAQMKERIARRIASPALHAPAVPWPRIAAAAAIVIVAGAGAIGIWLRLQEKETPPAPAAPTSQETHAAGHDMDRALAEAPPPPPSEKKVAGKREERAAKDELQSVGAAQSEGLAKSAPATSDAATQEALEGVWTEGIVSEEPAAAAAAKLRLDKREKSRPAAVEMQTNAARKSAVLPATPQQEVILNQQPLRTLQNRQQTLQQNSIPTLARQVGNQLNLTLYPDSLYPEEELQQATVSRPVDDSLIIRVGNQQIRYRLPSSLLQQKNAR